MGNLLVKNGFLAAHGWPCRCRSTGAAPRPRAPSASRSSTPSTTPWAATGTRRPVAAIVTRTLVDRDDPGFTHPTKPIGRYLSHAQAQPMIDHGQVWQDRGEKGWRRVVASEPLEVLDVPALLTLLEAGHVVVAAGGGGIPVVRDAAGRLRGVEAVIDKDLTAALLARTIGADVLVIATDVDHAAVDQHPHPARPRPARDGLAASGPRRRRPVRVGVDVPGGRRHPLRRRRRPRSVITSLTHITDAVEGSLRHRRRPRLTPNRTRPTEPLPGIHERNPHRA